MQPIPTKTLTNGFSLPVYGLGTWQMGGRGEPDHTHDEQEITAIKQALNLGITHIDTAEMYGAGHSEELVGAAITDYDRAKLFITSKVSAHNQRYDDLLQSCAASLKQLNTNYLDLYLLHRYPEPGIPIAETMRAINQLMSEGKIKHIGVCNFTVPMLEEIKKHTPHPIVCNQVHYSLRCREIVDKGILEYCQANDIMIVAWGPLEKALLQQGGLLETIAGKYNKTPYQVALNWLISQPGVVTISKTSQLKHLEENLGALGWQLSKEDITNLTDNFPDQIIVSDRVPLEYTSSLLD